MSFKSWYFFSLLDLSDLLRNIFFPYWLLSRWTEKVRFSQNYWANAIKLLYYGYYILKRHIILLMRCTSISLCHTISLCKLEEKMQNSSHNISFLNWPKISRDVWSWICPNVFSMMLGFIHLSSDLEFQNLILCIMFIYTCIYFKKTFNTVLKFASYNQIAQARVLIVYIFFQGQNYPIC